MWNQHKNYFYSFDWVSFITTFALGSIGLLFVFSATTTQSVVYSSYFKKQLFGLITGFFIYLFFCFSDYRLLCRIGYFIYFLIIGLLIYTLIKGKIGMGAQRWIDLKLFKFQPSELTKLFFPAFFTYFLYTENDVGLYEFHHFIPILLIMACSFLFILKQPDLGTALVFAFSGLVLLWIANIGTSFFRWGLLLVIIGAPVGWKYLKPYQKQRIAVFLGAGQQHKERYQIEQSKIAIGSGGLTGKGFCKGTQNKLYFLPESRTDFIFSVICEEWGFIGAFFVIFLYLILLFNILYKICKVDSFFTQLLGIGLWLPITFATLINSAMVTGLLPIVGIPLPLMSYGVTSLWITLASLGWIQSITRKTR